MALRTLVAESILGRVDCRLLTVINNNQQTQNVNVEKRENDEESQFVLEWHVVLVACRTTYARSGLSVCLSVTSLAFGSSKHLEKSNKK